MSLEPQPTDDGTIFNPAPGSDFPVPNIDYSKLDQETLYKMFAHKITITEEELERRKSEPTFTYEQVKAEIQRQLAEKYPGEE